MSHYRDRVGQRIGPWVITRRRKTTKQGKVLWELCNTTTGENMYLKTYELIRMDRNLNPSGTDA